MFFRSYGNVIQFSILATTVGFVGSLGIALLLALTRDQFGSVARSLLFLPGAINPTVVGLIFIFMLDPVVSPFGFLFRAVGWNATTDFVSASNSVTDFVSASNSVVIMTALRFFMSSGAWIAIFYSALEGVSQELIDSAKIDGCSPWQLAWLVRRPMIMGFVWFMIIQLVAYNLQIFAEPYVISTALGGASFIDPYWSPNMLGSFYTLQRGDLGMSAVVSLSRHVSGRFVIADCDQYFGVNLRSHQNRCFCHLDRLSVFAKERLMAKDFSYPNRPTELRHISNQWLQRWLYRTGIGPGTYVVRIIIISLLIVTFLTPMLWLVTAMTKTNAQLVDLPPFAIGSLDWVGHAWNNLLLFLNGVIVRWILNSIQYTTLGLILSLLTAIPAGFVLAVIKFRGRRVILWITLIMMLVPGDALVLPLYMEMFYLRIINTPWALVLPAASFPMGVYLSFQYFKASLPPDIIAAARVDGCSNFQLFRYIGLPLSKNIVGVLAFTNFAALWSNFFAATLLVDRRNPTGGLHPA